jgi:hypothetical protein
VSDDVNEQQARATEATMATSRIKAAVEVDHPDYEHQQGWSVVALGRLEELAPEEVDDLGKVWEPRPWAGGPS